MPLRHQTNSGKLRIGVAVVMSFLVLALSSLSVEGASSIAQGFKTEDTGIVSGALVSLRSDEANAIELTTVENLDKIVGIAGENALIELSNEDGTVQVVTTGDATALVSDINGEVRAGDKITVSPIAGVGMKALTSTLIIGTAQADLSGVSTQTRSIKNKDGRDQEVHIGAIPILVDKVFYEVIDQQGMFVPPALQDFANSLAGRAVSPIRVMIAGILILFVFVAALILLYSSVRSSIISIGRNPLSEHAVRKGLSQVGLTVFGIMAFTVVVIYLILTT